MKKSEESGTISQVEIALLSQRDWLTEENLKKRMPGGTLQQDEFRLVLESGPETDLVIVQNYLRYDQTLWSRRGFVWKWDLEPIVRDQPGNGYSRVFTHLDLDDPRITLAPPILDWWVNKSFDELMAEPVPEKTRMMSAIASTKDWIEGHRLRSAFIERVQTEFPQVDVFGRGRTNELHDKWEGLAPYRYSIAIENTSKPHYWTEKISDCFLSYTVPIYFGATNLASYFPTDSYIWIPLDDMDEAVTVIRHTLESDSWERRLPSLKESRSRVLERYSLYGRLNSLVAEQRQELLSAPRVKTTVQGRRTRRGGWIRNAGFAGNLRALFARRKARQIRGS